MPTKAASSINNFRSIADELDLRNEKAERMVKLSRDITINSKKIIFLMHRALLQNTTERIKSIRKADDLLKKLRNFELKQLARELINESSFYFNRSFSPGIQEYVEAISFLQYLKDETLISYRDVQQGLIFEDDEKEVTTTESDIASGPEKNSNDDNVIIKPKKQPLVVQISQHEYILGVLDLTGELMRAGINSPPGPGHLEFNLKTCKFLQLLHEGFSGLYGYQRRELSRKLTTLLSSLLKLENYSYNLTIRETFEGVAATPLFFDTLYENRVDRDHFDNYDSGLE